MPFPVRCFTCGKVLGGCYENYRLHLKNDVSGQEALDLVGAQRLCCRRMLISHVDLDDQQLLYQSYFAPYSTPPQARWIERTPGLITRMRGR